jgi:hypothetical protein
MKYLLSLLCFHFFCNRILAQSTENSSISDKAGLKISVSGLPRTTILFHPPSRYTSYPGMFNHFEVIDERVDTARIGIRARTVMFSHNHDRQLVFGRPAATEIAGYLNAHFSRQGAPFTALLVLRTLWLSDGNYTADDVLRNPDKKSQKFQIRLKAEIYAGKDGLYLPVFRYDTLATRKGRNNGFSEFSDLEMEYDLSNLFNDLADSASLVAGHKAGNNREVSRDQIREFNRSRFSIPMDSETVYAPGVYASFEEFRNNTPSIQDFEIKTEGRDILLYIKGATGSSYYSHDAWGYSDGKSLYIMKGGILWPAWKEGRAIYFYGLAYKIELAQGGGTYSPGSAGSPGGVSPSYSNTNGEVKCIYTVDMDTGELY